MSIDARYVVILEGPFAEDEVKKVFDALPPQTFPTTKQELGYEVFTFETKWSRDREVIEACKLSTPTQILRRDDFSLFEEIYNIRKGGEIKENIRE